MTDTKVCTSCKVLKQVSDFYTDHSQCKVCEKLYRSSRKHIKKEQDKLTYLKKREEKLVYQKQYRDLFPEKIKERKKEYYQRVGKFKDEIRREAGYFKQYSKNNAGKINAKTAKRRALKKRATPKWITELQWNDMRTMYIKAKQLSNEKTSYEVDHIIPINSSIVCGLHVPWNLQIIEKSLNRQKSNKVPV